MKSLNNVTLTKGAAVISTERNRAVTVKRKLKEKVASTVFQVKRRENAQRGRAQIEKNAY